MKSNAPGQLLGYSLQFPRTLYHLLMCSPGDIVCVEVLGDVATLTSTGELRSEEDKSSIRSNPITDRSTDLWKTFSYWIYAINDGDLDVEKTQFVLYCNHSGREAIVNRFNSAESEFDAKSAIKFAKEELHDIKPSHEIWKYFDFVVNDNEALLIKLIQKFELEIGNGAGFDEVRNEIQRLHIPKNNIEFILDKLCGWVLRVVNESIAARTNATISWELFHEQFAVLIERLRFRELIDFTLHYPIQKKSVQSQMNTRPIYLQQLEVIGLNDEDLLQEVSDYLRASVNRQKWIEDGIIDEEIAKDFEDRLKRFWANQSKRIQLTEKNLNEIELGQLLLSDCKSRQDNIRGVSPPASTIPGTYHALADEPTIGWHPKWETLFKRRDDFGNAS